MIINQLSTMPDEHVELWKAKLSSYRSVSALLRDLAKEYAASRNDAGAMLYSIFDHFSMDELGYIWKWDIERSGVGLTDERVDQLLAHLLAKESEG